MQEEFHENTLFIRVNRRQAHQNLRQQPGINLLPRTYGENEDFPSLVFYLMTDVGNEFLIGSLRDCLVIRQVFGTRRGAQGELFRYAKSLESRRELTMPQGVRDSLNGWNYKSLDSVVGEGSVRTIDRAIINAMVRRIERG